MTTRRGTHLFGAEVDALGIASALNVEDTRVGPHVLVVTDEETVRVGTEGGLAGTAETEEECDIALGTVGGLGLVGRRVEGELTELDGLEVVHDGEDSLFHLARVLCAENDHLHALKVDLDRGGRGHTGGEAVGGELARVVDDEIWLAKVGEFFGGRADEHVVLPLSILEPIGEWGRRTMKRAW